MNSLPTVVAILLAGILMFVFPMMALSERNDDVAQLTVNTAVAEFVNDSCAIGKITADNYDKLLTELSATGNTYDISLEIQVLDESPAKLVNPGDSSVIGKIGENVYYSVYTNQIMPDIDDKGYFLMKEGDILTCSASNSNQTISQMLKNFFYGLSGNNVYSIVGAHSGTSTCEGHA